MKSKWKTYGIGILIPVAVGLLAAFFTRNSMDVYDTVTKPPLAPPGILFPIVWTVLYVLMGLGSVLVWESKASAEEKSKTLLFYGAQLLVNFFWSIFFFNLRAFFFSFVWLVLLWGLVIAMIASFFKANRLAAYLQIPYLVWISFAGYLNLAIVLLN